MSPTSPTPRGWLQSKTVGSLVTNYSYDSAGQLVGVSYPNGLTITYTYDAAHRLTDITDALGNRIHYTLDDMGNRTNDATYNAAGNQTGSHSRVFNSLNRLYQDIGALNQTTTYSYDNNGNVLQVTDPLNHSSQYQYDALSRLIQTTDANSGISHASYNPLDQLTRIIDPRNLATTYTKNAFGDTITQTSPDSGTTQYTYDLTGNLTSQTDARGQITRYTYDEINRVTSMTYGNITDRYIWDQGANGIGHLTSMTDATGSTSWAYDSQGRLQQTTQTTQGLTSTTRYSYDSNGRLAALTSPSGLTVGYRYNSNGQVEDININGTPAISNIRYQPFGAAQSWVWGNGTTYTRSFNSDGKLATFNLGSNDTRSLTYDAASRITGVTDSNPASSQSYAYDNLDRLSSWIAPGNDQRYQYDANGNRTGMINGSSSSSYNYPATSNHLASITGANPNAYTWNASGDLLSQTGQNYTYDARDRMVSATTGNGTAAFGINGLGQRVYKKTGNTITLFAYDADNHLLDSYDSSTTSQSETIWLGDIPVLQVTNNTLYFIYTDQINTPRLITNSTNTPVWRWDADPFGSLTADNHTNLDVFNFNLRFPGQFHDPETGLNYNLNRDYDATTGRYVETDPIGLAGGSFSTYAYVGGNPVSYTDPMGLSDIPSSVPSNIPGGPYNPAGSGQQPGTYYGPKQPSGPRTICRWVPPEDQGGPAGSNGYWKVNQPDQGSWQRYDQTGTPITPNEAHPGQSSSEPVSVPVSTGVPWWVRISSGIPLLIYSNPAY